ncbi:ABC transporter substrate-binding protein [Brachybacterium hainanense]|uniref:ABC transporter substrate-binding protein n=1 Tax=Brachybacterium hainanense TaxID=1541174 RepID=A0ABV6R673_9MICO
MRTLRRIAAQAVLGAVLLATAGCTAPEASASVTVLCSNDAAICAAWAEDFARQTGTAVTMDRLPTSEALERIRRGEGLPEYDVWHGGGSEMYVAAAQEGLLAPYPSPQAEGIPAELREPRGRWTGVYVSFLGFCADAARLEQIGAPVPRSWEDLLDPALAGWVSAASPRTSGTAYTTMLVQLDRRGEQEGLDYLSRLYAQVPQFTRSGTAPAQVVAQGEAAVGISFAPYCEAAAAAGAPVTTILPRDGTGYEVGAVAVLADAPHPAAARRYVDHAVSEQGQRSGASSGIHQVPTQTGLPGSFGAVRGRLAAPLLMAPLEERAARRDALLDWFAAEVPQ